MKILTAAKIGNVTLKNRVIFPSMCNEYCDEKGFVTPQLEAFVRARARGGTAAIIMPGSPHGKPGPARPALSDPRYYAGWKALKDICHAENCRLFVQIHPAKAQAGRDPSLLLPDHMPRDMIREIVASYAACARAAREIGLDGAEIHGAHAHEVAQFMSPYYNRRADEYGGSTRARCRLAVEVIRAIKEEAGEDFPLIFRISSDERIPGGRELGETLEIARMLEEAGADALHVSTGMPLSEGYISAPMDVEDGFNLEQIARVHEAVQIPVIAVNRICTPALAEQVIATGQADFVAIGRGQLADPDFVRKLKTGEPIRRCLGCNQGCRKSKTKKPIYCVQNPMTGREATLRFPRNEALADKRVLVIGAGVAGLEVAMDLARRGAKPEVWEREAHAGGLLEWACIPPHKEAMRRMTEDRLTELGRMNVPVRYGYEGTAARAAAFAPDLIILATGSMPEYPKLPGLEDAHVYSAEDALGRMREGLWPPMRRCAVLGGGLVGYETADALCARHIRPEIFEQAEHIGEGINKYRRYFIDRRLEEGGCVAHCRARIEAVRFPAVDYTQDGEARSAGPFDAVIVALGRKSRNALADALRAACPQARLVCLGDARKPGTAMDAVADAALFAAEWNG